MNGNANITGNNGSRAALATAVSEENVITFNQLRPEILMSKLNEYGPEKFLTQVIDESVKFPTQQEQDNFLEQIIDMLLVENCNSQDRDDVNKDSVRLNVSKVVNNILDNQEKGASHSAVEIVEAGLVKHVYESSRLNMWKNEEQVLERKISKLKPLHYGDQNVSIDPEEI